MSEFQLNPEAWRDSAPERAPRPAWVKRWERAREAGDTRLFPEQENGIRQLHNTAIQDYPGGRSGYEEMLKKLRVPYDNAEVWVQEGEYA